MNWDTVTAALNKEFPRDVVHWRAQTLTKKGDKALALAYIDSRDVQDRLDDAVSPWGWQTEYDETPKGRMICRIGIKMDDEWVWKGDGAGDTAVEGEKGGISDAFKRAAVHWGIGRYLYRLDAVWCPCEVGNNGKWLKWSADPWNYIRGSKPPAQPKTPPAAQPTPAETDTAIAAIKECDTLADLQKHWAALYTNTRHVADHGDVIVAKNTRKAELENT